MVHLPNIGGDTVLRRAGVSELCIDQDASFLVYFIRHYKTFFVLLTAGDKSTQAKDIKAAMQLARNL